MSRDKHRRQKGALIHFFISGSLAIKSEVGYSRGTCALTSPRFTYWPCAAHPLKVVGEFLPYFPLISTHAVRVCGHSNSLASYYGP